MEFVNRKGMAFAILGNGNPAWVRWDEIAANAPQGYYSFTSLGKAVQALGPPPPAGVTRPGFTWTVGVPQRHTAETEQHPQPPADPWAATHARLFGDKEGPRLPASAKPVLQQQEAVDASWETSIRRVTGGLKEG